MSHILFGLILIGIGIWWVFDMWYYLMDLSKGAIPVFMIVLGLASLWIAVAGEDAREDAKNDVNSGGPSHGRG